MFLLHKAYERSQRLADIGRRGREERRESNALLISFGPGLVGLFGCLK